MVKLTFAKRSDISAHPVARKRSAEGLEVAEMAEPGERPAELAAGTGAGAHTQAPPDLLEVHAVLALCSPGEELEPQLAQQQRRGGAEHGREAALGVGGVHRQPSRPRRRSTWA